MVRGVLIYLSSSKCVTHSSFLLLFCRLHTADDDGADQEEYQENAELLYGMIHARYIITMHGMEMMVSHCRRGWRELEKTKQDFALSI
jgi:hypothetical protein